MSNDHDTLIEIKTTVGGMASDISEIRDYLKTQNGRLRKVENKTAYIMGVGAVLVIVVNVLSRWLL